MLIVKDVVKRMDSNYHISLIDIGLVIEKLVGNGYVSEYSKKDFKNKYLKFEYKNVSDSRAQLTSVSSFCKTFLELYRYQGGNLPV